jgi:hypothetical protein
MCASMCASASMSTMARVCGIGRKCGIARKLAALRSSASWLEARGGKRRQTRQDEPRAQEEEACNPTHMDSTGRSKEGADLLDAQPCCSCMCAPPALLPTAKVRTPTAYAHTAHTATAHSNRTQQPHTATAQSPNSPRGRAFTRCLVHMQRFTGLYTALHRFTPRCIACFHAPRRACILLALPRSYASAACLYLTPFHSCAHLSCSPRHTCLAL